MLDEVTCHFKISFAFGIGICVEDKYISKLANSWRDTTMSIVIVFGNLSRMDDNNIKNPPYIRSFPPPSPCDLPPRKLQRRELLPSYVDPIKIHAGMLEERYMQNMHAQ
jgi:hypothetical protein